jgi:hypothetical protein
MFAGVLGRTEDSTRWSILSGRRIQNTRGMFVGNWFRDFDARTGQPIILKDYFDVMMLAPVACGVATPEQVEELRPMFAYFRDHPAHWLEWPPQFFTYAEAAWNASVQSIASEVVVQTADRVYHRTDARSVLYQSDTARHAYRIPGVANEYWPIPERPAGGENYGWGATLPVHIIRSIIGFRESNDAAADQFYVAPSLPEWMRRPGAVYTITNLKYREHRFALTYRIQSPDSLRAELRWETNRPSSVVIVNDQQTEHAPVTIDEDNRTIFAARNGTRYRVTLEISAAR